MYAIKSKVYYWSQFLRYSFRNFDGVFLSISLSLPPSLFPSFLLVHHFAPLSSFFSLFTFPIFFHAKTLPHTMFIPPNVKIWLLKLSKVPWQDRFLFRNFVLSFFRPYQLRSLQHTVALQPGSQSSAILPIIVFVDWCLVEPALNFSGFLELYKPCSLLLSNPLLTFRFLKNFSREQGKLSVSFVTVLYGERVNISISYSFSE